MILPFYAGCNLEIPYYSRFFYLLCPCFGSGFRCFRMVPPLELNFTCIPQVGIYTGIVQGHLGNGLCIAVILDPVLAGDDNSIPERPQRITRHSLSI